LFYWIYDYPSWMIGGLFVGGLVALTWIGIFVTRATVHAWLHRDRRANEMVSITLSSYCVTFGLLLGLLAIATYTNYTAVSDIVDQEASSLSSLWKEISAYPQPIRGQLQNAVREYTRYTIEEGWRQQRQGILPSGEPQRSAAISKVLLSFEPSTEREKILFAATLQESTHRIQLSRARMSNVTLGLPAVLWGVVAFCTLLNIVLIWMQDMEIHVHLILGGVLAAVLAAVIFLIAELDNPFRGEVAVGPESIAHVYENVMRPGVAK
jgi:protein-S-isoprenylcysteine O-methyltransferase Ste14